jgi:predicted RNA-binding protein YlqC (UPF0109 family)
MTRDAKTDEVVKLLRELVLAYTRHGEHLVTEAHKLTTSISITMQAHRDDHPKIVGAGGKHIWALKTVFDFIGRGQGIRIRVTLIEPEVGEKMPMAPFQANPRWKSDRAVSLLTKILGMVTHQPCRVEAQDAGAETTLEVLPPPNERDKLLRPHESEKNEFGTALDDLFHAIGKAEGRNLSIDVIDPAVYAKK